MVIAPRGEIGRRLTELAGRVVRPVGVMATPGALAEVRSGSRAGAPVEVIEVVEVATHRDAVDLARTLYDGLRAAEQAGLEVLVVEAVDEVGVGRAVMDRLRRASAATSPSEVAARRSTSEM